MLKVADSTCSHYSPGLKSLTYTWILNGTFLQKYLEGSPRNNFRDVATSQALGNIPIFFSFQNLENRENLTSQILKNFQLVQT